LGSCDLAYFVDQVIFLMAIFLDNSIAAECSIYGNGADVGKFFVFYEDVDVLR
jgi:hypothetical protein